MILWSTLEILRTFKGSPHTFAYFVNSIYSEITSILPWDIFSYYKVSFKSKARVTIQATLATIAKDI